MLALSGTRRPVRALAYSPGGLLAVGGDDRRVFLYPPLTREPAESVPSRGPIQSLAFSPDGRHLAAGGRAGWLGAWAVDGWLTVHSTQMLDAPLVAVAFDRQGRAVLAAQASREYGGEVPRLLCLNVVPPALAARLAWPGQLESAAYSAALDLFALAGLHRGVELWEVGRPRGEPFAWMPSRAKQMAFSPDGRRLAVASGKSVFFYQGRPPELVAEGRGHRSQVLAVAFSADGREALSGGGDGSVRLWDAASGKQLAGWDWGLGSVFAVAFAPDGMTAAAGGQKQGVAVWDVDEG